MSEKIMLGRDFYFKLKHIFNLPDNVRRTNVRRTNVRCNDGTFAPVEKAK